MCGFGQAPPTGGFGSSTSSTNNTNPHTTGAHFGHTQQPQSQSGTGPFGNRNVNQQQSTNGFGGFATSNNGNNTTSSSLFGQPSQTQSTTSLFGNSVSNQQQRSGGLFGSSANTNGFGSSANNVNNNTTGGGLFGQPRASLFGVANNNHQQAASGPFGQPQNTSGGLFGPQHQQHQNGGLVGGARANNGSLFGNGAPHQSLFKNTDTTSPGASSASTQAGDLLSTPPSSNLFGNATRNCVSGSCCPATYPPQAPTMGTHDAASLEKFKEQDLGYKGTTSVYQHLSFLRPYQRHSAEELRLIDYGIGQFRAPFAEPSEISPFTTHNVNAESSAANVVSSGHTYPATATDIHASCKATIASKDAEIRLLRAKVVILEDRLQRANDTPRFGKPGLPRPSLFAQSPTLEGPRKSDPSIPINPDPRTNNTGIDLTTVLLKSRPGATRVVKNDCMPIPDEDDNTLTTTVLPQTPSLPTASNKVLREVVVVSSSNATKEDTEVDATQARFELQSKRMETIELQLQKVTALLEQQIISSSRSSEVVDHNKEKGKGRADEDEIDSGTSTPAIIVYTPGSSTAGFSDDETAVAPLAKSTDQDKEAAEMSVGVVNSSEVGLSLDAILVLHKLREAKAQMHVASLAKVCGISIRDASAAVEQLLEAKFIALGCQDCYACTQ